MDSTLASGIGRRSVKYFSQEPCSHSAHTARQFIRGKSSLLNLPIKKNDRSQFFQDVIEKGSKRFGDINAQTKYKAVDARMQSFNSGLTTKIMASDQQGNRSMNREEENDELRISLQESSAYLQFDSQCVHPLPLSPPVANETSLWSTTSDQIVLIHRPLSPLESIQTRDLNRNDRREKKSNMSVRDSETIVMPKSLEDISDISQTSNWNMIHEHPSTGNVFAGAFHSTFNYPLHSTLRDSEVTRRRSTLSNAVSSAAVDSAERNNENEIVNYVETSCRESKDYATHQLMLKKRRKNNWKFSCCSNRRSRCRYCNRTEAIYPDRVCKNKGNEASNSGKEFVSRTANRQKVLLGKIESFRSRRRRHGNLRSASDKENRQGEGRRTTTATWRRLRRQDALLPLDHRHHVHRYQKEKRDVEAELDNRRHTSLEAARGSFLFLTHVRKDQEYELQNNNVDRFCYINDHVTESTSSDSEVDPRGKMRIRFIADTFPRHTQETSVHLTAAEQRKMFESHNNNDAVSNEHNFLQQPRIQYQEVTRTKRNRNLIIISSQQIPSSYPYENISSGFLKGPTSITTSLTNRKQKESPPNYMRSCATSEAMKSHNYKMSVAKKFLCVAKALHRCRNDTNDTI